MAEIHVQYQSLESHTRALRRLAERLEDRRFITAKLLNESEGKACTALNETYELLCEMEQSLKNLVIHTADWLSMACTSFQDAEQTIVQDTGYTLDF